MPEPNIAQSLSPATLARIDNYSLIARVVVEGFISGLHRSLYQGFGSEFFQYRNYVPGDDLKYVDWKVFARRNKFYTKIFQEETNMNCCLVLDTSASMGYHGERAPCSKLRYASMIAACLAYLASRQGDNVGFYAYNDGLVSCLHPKRQASGLQHLFAELQRLTPSGTADYSKPLGVIAESFRRRGIVVLLSDFIGAENALPSVLKRFRFEHHECVVLQIMDPDELDLPFSKTLRFVDSETSAQIVTAPALVRESYTRQMTDFLEQIRLLCLEQQVDYLRVQTSDDLGNMMGAYLHRREALR